MKSLVVLDDIHPAVLEQERLGRELTAVDRQIAQLQRRREKILQSIAQSQSQIEDQARAEQTKENEKLMGNYDGGEFAWTTEVRTLLRDVFKIPAFRHNQEAIVNATLDGRDAVVIMHTGGGKSLCYQLPALVRPGLTLVISPLIALMDDQVMELKELGIAAEALTSESPNPNETKARLRKLAAKLKKRRRVDEDDGAEGESDDLRLLYVSPEKIVGGKQLLGLIEKIHAAGKLSRIVIDECHCASEYGNDFRPDYNKLGMLKYTFPDVPVLALSATCPPRVLDSVRKILGIEGGSSRPAALVFTSPLWRQNLRYSVLRKQETKENQKAQVIDWITQHHPRNRGIIYCATKSDAYELANALHTNEPKPYSVGLYYSNLEREKKKELHDMWRKGRVQVIVATNSFGMGVNSLDVRFVIHFTGPKSIENYYQESGRAGRDGGQADCVIFYRTPDSARLSSWGFDGEAVDGLAKARSMINYAECRHLCRKVQLQSYLQDTPESDIGSIEPCRQCDVCCEKRKVLAVDCTWAAISIINMIHAAGTQRITLNKMCMYLRGYSLRDMSTMPSLLASGKVKHVPMHPEDAGFIINRLIALGVLAETFNHTGYNTNAYLGIGPRYRHIAGRKVEEAQLLGPFMVEFTADAPPITPTSSAPAARRKTTRAAGKAPQALLIIDSDSESDDLPGE